LSTEIAGLIKPNLDSNLLQYLTKVSIMIINILDGLRQHFC